MLVYQSIRSYIQENKDKCSKSFLEAINEYSENSFTFNDTKIHYQTLESDYTLDEIEKNLFQIQQGNSKVYNVMFQKIF